MFFHLQPECALLGDINPDVITAFEGIRQDWKGLVDHLARHQSNHSESYYYQIRDEAPENLIERAARMIYLNRTCFNGIYRVNRNGIFNVPKGTKNNVLLETDDFEALAIILKNAQILREDFQTLIDDSRRGDLIFADPPYTDI